MRRDPALVCGLIVLFLLAASLALSGTGHHAYTAPVKVKPDPYSCAERLDRLEETGYVLEGRILRLEKRSQLGRGN